MEILSFARVARECYLPGFYRNFTQDCQVACHISGFSGMIHFSTKPNYKNTVMNLFIHREIWGLAP